MLYFEVIAKETQLTIFATAENQIGRENDRRRMSFDQGFV